MEEKSAIKNILEWVYCIIIAVFLALVFRYYIGTPTVVKMTSMYDTLVPNDRLILSRWTRTVHGKYSRGEIITFEAPSDSTPSVLDVNNDNPRALYRNNPKGFFAKLSYYVFEFKKTSYIKRVIGVEGDHIKIENDKVYLNGKELDEPYLNESVKTTSKNLNDFTVPEGYVFAMGDNRANSTDCREFGCVPLGKVESKVKIRFWPFNKFGKVDKF